MNLWFRFLMSRTGYIIPKLFMFTGIPSKSQLSPVKAWGYQGPEFHSGTNFAYYYNAESHRAQSSSQLGVNTREFVARYRGFW